MDLTQYRNKLIGSEDERAVSPVIGVILMVAITVILAAVIAAFVLDIGDLGDTAPSASFNWDQDGDGGTDDVTVSLEHTGGDQIDGGDLELQVSGDELSGSATLGDWGDVSAGSSLEVSDDVDNDQLDVEFDDGSTIIDLGDDESMGDIEELSLVWQSDDGSSQVLDDYEIN